MKHIVLAMAVLGLLAAGCEKKGDGRPQVTVYMYSEYIDPAIPEEFEKATGIKARIDVYENSEEMLAKLQQGGGAGQYDVIVVSDAHVPALIKLGLVRPLDMAQIPNAKNVDRQFQNPPFDPEGRYSLPYQWGTVGLMYNKEKAGSRPVSWSLIFDPKQQIGKYVLMDSMRDMLGIALKYQGKSMNSRQAAEVRSAGDLVLAAKKSPNSLGFEGGVGGKNRVMAGEAAAAIVYNGDAIKAIAENPGAKVGFEVPGEGGIIWVDVMLIPSKAPNSEGAHRFINYILDPAVGAQLSNFNHYATPNAASMPQIKEEDRRNPGIYPGPEIMKKLEYLEDVGQDTKIYDEVWTSVKAK